MQNSGIWHKRQVNLNPILVFLAAIVIEFHNVDSSQSYANIYSADYNWHENADM